jgi:hypothetical protein
MEIILICSECDLPLGPQALWCVECERNQKYLSIVCPIHKCSAPVGEHCQGVSHPHLARIMEWQRVRRVYV